MTTKTNDTPKLKRAPRNKTETRRKGDVEPYAGKVFDARPALIEAVRAVAIHRLLRDYGIPWDPAEQPLSTIVRSVVKIPTGSDGRGRRPDNRARFVFQMERKDLVGAALSSVLPGDEYERMRGIACTKTELALIWLLVFGIGATSRTRELATPTGEGGMTAAQVIEREIANMKRYQAPDRHGYPDTWDVAATGYGPPEKGDRVVNLDAGTGGMDGPKRGIVHMRKRPRKPRGHRPAG